MTHDEFLFYAQNACLHMAEETHPDFFEQTHCDYGIMESQSPDGTMFGLLLNHEGLPETYFAAHDEKRGDEILVTMFVPAKQMIVKFADDEDEEDGDG